ncbi:MAG: hypothetical protein IT381_08395 [Deltaproteobacteria bacterium]|nr:hypothetical protein [Deltaproteobacteria bacterium]
MPAIKDKALAKIYTGLETQLAANPATKIDSTNVVELLATVADGGGQGGAAALVQALKAAASKQAQLDIVKKGLSAGEKKDLEAILDSGTVPVAAEWKNFFEAVVGRATLNNGGGGGATAALKILGDQAGNVISGTAKAGVVIEAINVTTAPGGRFHIDDTVQIATADASGKFTGKLTGPQLDGTKTGDLIRLRTRDASGKTSDWVTVRASGLGASDTRNAVVALFRIGLSAEAGGKIAVANINESRQISEPGAQIQFKNERTGKTTLVTLDDEGQFPKNLKLEGKAGDKITVAATDGTNNKTFSRAEGTLTVPGGNNGGGGIDLPDPALHKDELDANGKPRFSTARFSGPLFIADPSPMDVAQGQIGDCYFPSAMAAIAAARPEAIKKMLKDNGDGTYTVTFKQWARGGYKDVPIKIDGDLYVRTNSEPLYGSTPNENGPTSMEMWFPLIEKAYATWKGSYNAIGNGGSAGTVMEECLGLSSESFDLDKSAATVKEIWEEVKSAVDNKRPASLGTSDDDNRYRNTGIFGDHSYSILGYEEKNGKKLVKLRNPWGESEPAGNGSNDGVFFMSIETVCALFDNLDTVR